MIAVNILGYFLTLAMLLVSLSSAILIGIEESKLHIEIIYFTSTAVFCFTIVKITRNVFVRGVFTWLMGFDMFLYLLCYLLMVVTVISSYFKYRIIGIILMVIDCGLMGAYTKCVTVCYMKHREFLNLRRQAHLSLIETNKLKPSSHKSRKGCIQVPIIDDD